MRQKELNHRYIAFPADIRYTELANWIRVSKGFDRDFEAGEAIRRTVALNLKLKLNANDNLALAA